MRGLTLGKYAPFHRGHQLVIETALAECDELIVLAYDAPSVTTIPLPIRAGWIRELHPTVRVIEVWDAPEATGDDPNLQREHERCIARALRGTRIDRFHSSEPYGAHVARSLGASDCRVDEARSRVPVSATAIREDWLAHREWLPSRVSRDLVLRVAILGAPSTGKTTLAERLATQPGIAVMPEHGREFWHRHQVDRRLTPEQLVDLAREHAAREDAMLDAPARALVTDTNALTTLVYSQCWHGHALPELVALADACARTYDLTLVCVDDIPHEDTWDRSGAGNRRELQRRLLAELALRRIAFVELRGAPEAREQRALDLIARTRRFAGPSG